MPAHAGSLQISPVIIDLQANQATTNLHLRNPSQAPLYGQIRVFRWDQASGEDTLTPTQDLAVSPPIMQIQAQGEQIVRLVRIDPKPTPSEQSYRVLVDEIPQNEEVSGNMIAIRLRYSVPIFIAASDDHPDTNPEESVRWRIQRRDNAWYLKAKNIGVKHAKVSTISLINAAGKEFPITSGLLGYALAGREREWRLELPPEANLNGALTIKTIINAQQFNFQTSVEN